MDKNTVLSLSSDQAILKSRQTALRKRGYEGSFGHESARGAIQDRNGKMRSFPSLLSAVKGCCGRFDGAIPKDMPPRSNLFVTQAHGDNRVPAQADIAVPESSGPQKILEALKPHVSKVASLEQPGDTSQGRSGEVR